jgi:hypothetical protein
MLVAAPWKAHGQTSSSSRPLSATVVSTYVVRNGDLALLVLWRGSPGWFSRGGGGHSSSGGGGGGTPGREVGSFTLTYGGRTFSIDFDYTAGVARLLGQEILLAGTNVVLVDDVDRQTGARVVGRLRVDPTLSGAAVSRPRTVDDDPAIIAVRRSPEAATFLQCGVPMPVPPELDTAVADPAARQRVTDYMQGVLTQVCRDATGR